MSSEIQDSNNFKYGLLGGMFFAIVIFASFMYSQTKVGDDIKLNLSKFEDEVSASVNSLIPNGEAEETTNQVDFGHEEAYNQLLSFIETEYALGKIDEKMKNKLMLLVYQHLRNYYFTSSQNVLMLSDSLAVPKLDSLINANLFLKQDSHYSVRDSLISYSYVREAQWWKTAYDLKNEFSKVNSYPGRARMKTLLAEVDSLSTDTSYIARHTQYASLPSYKDSLFYMHKACLENLIAATNTSIVDNLAKEAQACLNDFKEMLGDYGYSAESNDEEEDSDEESEETVKHLINRLESQLNESNPLEDFYAEEADLPNRYGNFKLLYDTHTSVYRSLPSATDGINNVEYNVGDKTCTFFFNNDQLVGVEKSTGEFLSPEDARTEFLRIAKYMQKHYAYNKKNKENTKNIGKTDTYTLRNTTYTLSVSLEDNNVVSYSIMAN